MHSCKIVNVGPWIHYLSEDYKPLPVDKCGKWMFFFNDVDFASEKCRKAIECGICRESKHSNKNDGVCCFYINGDDIDGHKRVIRYFMDNNLIPKTKNGRLYNISFKYDHQTDNGEYGEDFVGTIKLADFMNLSTGEWLR